MYALADGPVRVTRTPLPAGDRGTRRTLEAMSALARQWAMQPIVRDAALAAIRGAGARAHQPLAEARAIFRYVRDRVRFTQDPIGTEWVQSPRVTLETLSGDCDDMATLTAAMLRSVGIPSRFRAVAVDRSRPRSFSHVLTIARLQGRDVALDPIYHSNELGETYPEPFRVMELPA